MSVTLHTSLGDLKLEIYCDTVPKTAFNFLALAASGAYDGTTFHRNIRGFMIQGGDPTGTGKGGDSIWGGTFEDEFHPNNVHDRRGVVSMANKGPSTNRVIDGWEVLDQMERLPCVGGAKKSKANMPVKPPVIETITIHANPLAEEGIVYPSKDGPPERVQ